MKTDFIPLRDVPGGIEAIREKASKIMSTMDKKDEKVGRSLLCQYDLRYLCRDVLKFEDWSEFHDDLQAFLDSSTKQYKLLLLPRGHLKSSIVTVGRSIQKLLQNPNVRILIANAIWDNARNFLDEIQHHLDDCSHLPRLFGEFKGKARNAKGWNRDYITIEQRKQPLAAATITTTGVERTQASQHYDYIILDDVVARENTSTKDQREKIKKFYKDCLSLLEPDGELLVIGTTWHQDDLYNDLRENPRFDTYIRTAVEKGEVIFPRKFSLEKLGELKEDLGVYEFSSQYMLNPYPEEDQQFRKDWIKYYDDLPNEPMFVALTIDPSMGKEQSDYAAIAVTGIDRFQRKFVIEARRFKCRVELIPSEVVDTVNKLKLRGIKVDIIGLESFGFQEMLYEPLCNVLRGAGINIFVELLPKRVTASKGERISCLIPHYANGTVYHKRFAFKDLENEMLIFSPNARHSQDDVLDALAWQVKYWINVPKEEKKEDAAPESFEWWLHKNMKRKRDLFEDFRVGAKNNPGVLV